MHVDWAHGKVAVCRVHVGWAHGKYVLPCVFGVGARQIWFTVCIWCGHTANMCYRVYLVWAHGKVAFSKKRWPLFGRKGTRTLVCGK